MRAAATDHEACGRARQHRDCARKRGCGECGQRCRAVFGAHAGKPAGLRHPGFEGIAVQRLGRAPRKISVRQKARERVVIHASGSGGLAVMIAGGAGSQPHKIVDQRIAGPGVECHEVIIVDIGEVGDAAEIDHPDRLGAAELAHERTVEHRNERRALPAGRDVGGPQIVDHRNPQPGRERPPVPELDCQRALGRMQHGLAVEADDRNCARAHAVLRQERFDRLGVGGGNQRFGRGQASRPGGAITKIGTRRNRAPNEGAFALIVRPVTGWPEAGDILTVGVDERHVHAIVGGAAHETDRRLGLHPSILGFHPTPDLLHHRPETGDNAMSTYKSDFLHVLASRGFIHQVSEPGALDALAKSSRLTGYIGFDCTAPSLHIGNLMVIMLLYWLQQTGHRPLALMGGGTTRVGDPSGKDETRRILSEETINENLRGIRAVFSKFLKFGDGPGDAIMANNADWLNSLNYIDFLRDVGRHFSVNRMLSFDSVKMRIDRQQELSFLEFNYMVLQAYDFVELHKRYGCLLQMGASDQWGNIVSGIDLGRRMGTPQLYALTCPLLTTSSGAKMGKTAAGAVWLNADMVSPYDYWQYLRNTEDGDVARFLKLFTVLPLKEIGRLAALEGQEINEAKKVLATEATALVHGRAAAEQAARTAQETFEQRGMGESLPTLTVRVGDGILSVNTKIGFTSSNSQARQFVKDGAVYLGNRNITDISYKLRPEDFDQDGRVLLRLGPKRRGILTLGLE